MTFASSETQIVHSTTDSTPLSVHKHAGTGPEVLLIHGISSSSADFNPVIQGMGRFSRPITLDLRGHGASGKPASGYHYRDYISDLTAVIAALKLENPIIIGHSLGGIVTLMWAAMNPQVPAALVIEDSPLRSGEGFREAFEGWLHLNALPQELARAWYANQYPHWSEALLDQRSFDMVNTARAAILELQELSLSGEGVDSVGDLGAITAPLLFLQGDPAAGSMVFPGDLAALQELLPQTQAKQFPKAGHTIHRSHTEEWLRQVKRFLDTL